MGTLNIGANALPGGFAHAFVEISLGGPRQGASDILQLHGEPLGGAVEGGLGAPFSDSVPISIVIRVPERDTPERISSYTLASGIPDSVLVSVFSGVQSDAAAKFRGAEYEIPTLLDSFSLGIPVISFGRGALSVQVLPPNFHLPGTNPD